MSDDIVAKGLRDLERELDLGDGFLIKLWGEKDGWTFVIRSHALLETTISELLTKSLLNPKLESIVDYLPMGGRTGKVAFLRAVGALAPADQTFLDELQFLRNRLVHNVHNTSFDFNAYLATNTKDAQRLAEAASAFGATEAICQRYADDFKSNPRHVIWLAVLVLVARTRVLLSKTADGRKDLEERIRTLFGQ